MRPIKNILVLLFSAFLSTIGELLPTTGSLLKYLQPSTILYTSVTLIGLGQYFLLNNLIHIIQLKLFLSNNLEEKNQTKKITPSSFFLFGFIYLVEAVSIGLILEKNQVTLPLASSSFALTSLCIILFFFAALFKVKIFTSDLNIRFVLKKKDFVRMLSCFTLSIFGFTSFYLGNMIYSSEVVRTNNQSNPISAVVQSELGNVNTFIIAVFLVSLVPFFEILIYKTFIKPET